MRRWLLSIQKALRRSEGVALVAVLLFAGHARAQETVTYYTTDAVGSIRMVTDAAGAVLARYDYLPFGDRCGSACGPVAPEGRLQFAGKERDGATGFDYFGARYYVSGSGRFTTIDPVVDVEHALTDPQRWNRYAYALNNPFTHLDPDGRNPILVWIQMVLNSPQAQRVSQAIATQGANLTMAAMRIMGSPATPELAQAMAELATSAELPGGLPATGAAHLLPSKVADRFVGPVHRLVAQSDLTAFRFWAPGSKSEAIGRWLTTESTVLRIRSPNDAVQALNLDPSGNLATMLSRLTIPKGTELFVGRVRNGQSWATQIWIREKDRLRLLGQVDGYGLEP